MLMPHRKVEGLNKKTKITISLILITTALFAVVFLLNKPKPEPPASSEQTSEQTPEQHEGHVHDSQSVDNSITAGMQVHKGSNQAPVIKVTKDGVQSESEKWETKFFNNYLDETLVSLPSLKDFENLKNKDVHHDPEFVMESGLRLGKIKKQVKLNRDFAPKAIEFYTNCANKKDGFTPIRGLCLANLITMKKEEGVEVDTSDYPSAVVELAKKALEFSF